MSGKLTQAKHFVDTNILIYAHDLDAGEKHLKAAEVVRTLWDSGTGVLSTQVLQEFYVNVTRKIPQPLPLSKARGLVGAYGAWDVSCPTLETLLAASEIQERHQLSFWDAMIVAAAQEAGADTLLTEDLNHGQLIEGIHVVNPLVSR